MRGRGAATLLAALTAMIMSAPAVLAADRPVPSMPDENDQAHRRHALLGIHDLGVELQRPRKSWIPGSAGHDGVGSDWNGGALRFSDLPGWAADDHAAALAALKVSCSSVDPTTPALRNGVPDGAALAKICRRAAGAQPSDARAFFETAFTPTKIGRGMLTGYYEPEVAGSLTPDGRFDTALRARPDDLVSLEPGRTAPGLPAGLTAGKQAGDRLEPYPARAAIEDGALGGRDRPLVYVERVDAFFTHVQGSARVRLADGTALRVAYDGKNGRPFTAIGRLLVERGAMTPETATMASIRAWLADHPTDGRELMRRNESYVFFRIDGSLKSEDGPRGAQKTPLTAGRSLAVDRALWPYGLPVFVDAKTPDGAVFRRLLVAQDTGSAIVGAARGDLFVGSGDAAGAIAGAMRGQADFFALLPKPGADR